MGTESGKGNEVEDDFDGASYVKRVADLNNPLSLDSPIFLAPRPDNSPPEAESGMKKAPRKLPTPLSGEEKADLKEEYYRSVKVPAATTLDAFPSDCITEVLAGQAWVVPGLLSEEECEQLVREGEEVGMEGSKKMSGDGEIVRTSKRTSNWANEELSIKLNNRLSEDLLKVVEATSPYTSVRGIHPNWRVARYQEGETFPAHVDQADSLMVQHPEKKRQRFTSSHTLLIYLRRRGEQFQGGATRLFPTGSYSGATIDVCLPQGYGLLFQQRGLMHAGLPVEGDGAKYIAQAGVLRAEPSHVTGACAIFKYGPGLAPY